jgi:putative Ca2+/H+ antiporter (TMEM165/GDT1 family)
MTLSNQERADRCQQAITGYSDDDTYTNLVDFLADAMHLCHADGHCFEDALDTARMHFEAELVGDDILEDFNAKATKERNQSMPVKKESQHDQRERLLRSVTEEALEAFWQVPVRRFPQAESGDLSPLATITLSTAAEIAIGEWIDNNVPTTTKNGD